MSALPAELFQPPAASTVSAWPCVLVNPRSFVAATNNRARKALALRRRFGVAAVPLQNRDHLLTELDRLRAAGQQRLFERDFNPYAGRGAGPVRLTAVRANAERFWRRLPWVVSGRFTDEMIPERGYFSGRFEQVSITGLRSFSLDGEPFEVDPSRPLLLQGGPMVRMLQL